MDPKVTVGISFKNPGEYFELAIKSVFIQTFTAWELLLVDDGSDDRSLEFARSIDDSRVSVYSDGSCKGLSVRLNQMVQLARSPYFFRMDADDLMHPLRIEKQYEILQQHDSHFVTGSFAYSIDDKSAVLGLKGSQLIQQAGFKARHSFHHPTVAATTAWFKANPYSEDVKFNRAEDAELWCRTTSTSKFLNIEQPLLFYREANIHAFDKYLASQSGAFQIINLYYQTEPSQLLYLLSRELFKLWLFVLLLRLNMSNFMVRRRYSQIDMKVKNEAAQAIASIANYSLPSCLK
jgi:glycosyltransferase involved in cell wall biosynthesis